MPVFWADPVTRIHPIPIGPLTLDERNAAINQSPVYGVYEDVLDRESAHEKLQQTMAAGAQAGGGQPVPPVSGGQAGGVFGDILFGRTGPRGGRQDGLVQTAAKSVMRTIGSAVGREIVRGLLGSILGGKR